MFDFSFWEISIVLIVTLLVVGPDKLPALASKAGRLISKAKRMMMSIRSDIEGELKAAELKEMLEKQQDEISHLRNIVNDAQSEIEEQIESIQDDKNRS